MLCPCENPKLKWNTNCPDGLSNLTTINSKSLNDVPCITLKEDLVQNISIFLDEPLRLEMVDQLDLEHYTGDWKGWEILQDDLLTQFKILNESIHSSWVDLSKLEILNAFPFSLGMFNHFLTASGSIIAWICFYILICRRIDPNPVHSL